MSKETVVLTGLVRWASVPPAEARKPHEDAFKESEPNNCSYEIEVECTEEQHRDLLAKMGKKPGDSFTQSLREYPADVLNKESGEVMATKTDKKFIRVKATKIKGEMEFKDIPVVDLNGDPLTQKIANDSKANVAISIEPVKKGSAKKAMRLTAVQVINLIPFEDRASSIPFKVNKKVDEPTTAPTQDEENW